jgi:hypothetical protein
MDDLPAPRRGTLDPLRVGVRAFWILVLLVLHAARTFIGLSWTTGQSSCRDNHNAAHRRAGRGDFRPRLVGTRSDQHDK